MRSRADDRAYRADLASPGLSIADNYCWCSVGIKLVELRRKRCSHVRTGQIRDQLFIVDPLVSPDILLSGQLRVVIFRYLSEHRQVCYLFIICMLLLKWTHVIVLYLAKIRIFFIPAPLNWRAVVVLPPTWRRGCRSPTHLKTGLSFSHPWRRGCYSRIHLKTGLLFSHPREDGVIVLPPLKTGLLFIPTWRRPCSH